MAFHVGIDDTDAGSSIGTGALARELMLLLERDLDARSLGITRHQLLVHPAIPYTSHNSAACLELQAPVDIERLAAACERFVRYLFHRGADPGLCVMQRSDTASTELLAFGQLAQREVVGQQEAVALARAQGVLLRPLGGSGQGIIGALCACALRGGGDDGRFIDLADLRAVRGEVTVAGLRQRSPIDRVVDTDGNDLDDDCVIETDGWVRPELRAGLIVLEASRRASGAGYCLRRERDRRAERAAGARREEP